MLSCEADEQVALGFHLSCMWTVSLQDRSLARAAEAVLLASAGGLPAMCVVALCQCSMSGMGPSLCHAPRHGIAAFQLGTGLEVGHTSGLVGVVIQAL